MLARFLGIATVALGLARAKEADMANPIMSKAKLTSLGKGEMSYIRILSSDEARAMFPDVEGIPDVRLFSLHAADGTPLALTDTVKAVLDHAKEDDLSVTFLH